MVLPAQTFLGVRFLNLKAVLALSFTDVATPGRGGVALASEKWHPVRSSAQSPRVELGIHPSSKEQSHPLVPSVILPTAGPVGPQRHDIGFAPSRRCSS